MATIGSHLSAVTKLAAAWTATANRATDAAVAIAAAKSALRSAARDQYDQLQEAAKAFGQQYASAGFNREGIAEGSYSGGFLTAAYARDVVKMYAIALAVTRNADGQLPGVIMEAYRSLQQLERFWQWAGFAMRYGNLESLASQELGGMPVSSGKYGKKATPGAAPKPPAITGSITEQQGNGSLRW